MNKFPFLILTALLLPLSLSSCGFQPMYGDYSPAAQAVNDGTAAQANARFADVYIDNIPDRSGQFLRNALIDRLYRSGRPANPLYTLKFRPLNEMIRELDVTEDAETTRSQLRLKTEMSLVDNATNKSVMSRELYASFSFNELGSRFATRVTEEDARAAALNDIARQVELNLMLYFNSNK